MYLDIPEIMTFVGALAALGAIGAIQYVITVVIGFERSWARWTLCLEVIGVIAVVLLKGGYPPFIWGFVLTILAATAFGYSRWRKEVYLRTPPADEPPKPRGIDMRI